MSSKQTFRRLLKSSRDSRTDSPNYSKQGLQEHEYPTSEEQFLAWCAGDPRFFLETCTLIRRKSGQVINWLFNSVQAVYHNRVYEYVEDHVARIRLLDNIVLKSRQYGQSTYELGDMYWQFCFMPGTHEKVIAYRDSTATQLKLIVDLLHESACEYFAKIGLDPDRHLPYVPKPGNQHALYAPFVGSRIEFTTEGAKGAGRALTVNRMYGTEYSEWTNVSDVMAGFGGSLSDEGITRVSLDFTGRGIGNAAYHEYQAAKKGESVYAPHFFGTDDYEYAPGFLAQQKIRLKRRFKQEYPRIDSEAFLKDANAIFDPENLERCRGETYSRDIPDFQPTTICFHVHGCDTAEGVPNGDNFALSGFHVPSMIEAYPAEVGKHSPRKGAHIIRRILGTYPGIVVIEDNNTGHSCIACAQDLEIEDGPLAGRFVGDFIYLDEKRDKKGRLLPRREWRTGYRTDAKSKQLFEDAMEGLIDSGGITLVGDNGIVELRQYQVLDNGKHGAPTQVGDDGTRFFDDEAISKMLAVMGIQQALEFRGAFHVDRTPAITQKIGVD